MVVSLEVRPLLLVTFSKTDLYVKLLKKSSGADLKKYLHLGDASDSEEIGSHAMLW